MYLNEKNCPEWGSNPQPLDLKLDALSIAPRGPCRCLVIIHAFVTYLPCGGNIVSSFGNKALWFVAFFNKDMCIEVRTASSVIQSWILSWFIKKSKKRTMYCVSLILKIYIYIIIKKIKNCRLANNCATTRIQLLK